MGYCIMYAAGKRVIGDKFNRLIIVSEWELIARNMKQYNANKSYMRSYPINLHSMECRRGLSPIGASRGTQPNFVAVRSAMLKQPLLDEAPKEDGWMYVRLFATVISVSLGSSLQFGFATGSLNNLEQVTTDIHIHRHICCTSRLLSLIMAD
eukprot:6212256-Pleurochrysis_carterae.AAC.3